MNKSSVTSSATRASKPKKTGKCHVCGETGHYARDCKDKKSDTENVKVVLDEVIGFCTGYEDPVLSLARARGWYMMTRCTVHVCNSRDIFDEYYPLSGHEVILDNSSHVDVLGIGTVRHQLTTGNILTLSNVFHIPAIRKCYVSISKLTRMGFTVIFDADGAVIESDHEIFGEAYREDDLYRLSIVTHVDEDQKKSTRNWYLNSRTTVHVCNSRDMYMHYQPVTSQNVTMDKDGHADVAGIGTVMVQLTTCKVLILSDVLHVPTMNKCVISVGKLDDNGYSVCFGAGEVVIQKNQEIVGKGYKERGLYRLSVMDYGPIVGQD